MPGKPGTEMRSEICSTNCRPEINPSHCIHEGADPQSVSARERPIEVPEDNTRTHTTDDIRAAIHMTAPQDFMPPLRVHPRHVTDTSSARQLAVDFAKFGWNLQTLTVTDEVMIRICPATTKCPYGHTVDIFIREMDTSN